MAKKRFGLGHTPSSPTTPSNGLNSNANRVAAPAVSRYFAQRGGAARATPVSMPATRVPPRYSLQANEVRRVIQAKLNGQPYDEQQFLFYHLHRNYFNVHSEITTLTKQGDHYVDNQGNAWQELSTFKNYFHMHGGDWVKGILGWTPASRKFIRDDTSSGIGGEFEMVIQRNGRRLDALVDAKLQETYNFGRTRNTAAHTTLDVRTHNANDNYTFRRNMGSVRIID